MIAKNLTDGESYSDSVGTERTRYYYPESRDGLAVTNKGTADILLIIDRTSYTIAPNKTQSVLDAFTSFSLEATSGTQAFIARAISESVRSGRRVNNIDIPIVNVVGLTPGTVHAVPFELEYGDTFNRVQLYIGATQAATLMQIAIYDSDFKQVVNSEVREIPPVGLHEIGLPETVLEPGKYYVAIQYQSTGTSVTLGTNPYVYGERATSTFPPPTQLSGIVPNTIVPSLVVKAKDELKVQGLFSISPVSSGVTVWAIYVTDGSLWGTAGSTFRKSVDNGATWTTMMSYSFLNAGENINDVIITGGFIYVLTTAARLFKSSDLTSAATWTDVSCPTPTRNPNAVGRPYALEAFGAFIYQAEYSIGPNELGVGGGPKILRYDPALNTWGVAYQTPSARHFHSFFAQGGSALWISAGDAGYGSGIGLYRLTSANQNVASGSFVDTWQQWTSPNAPNTNHYPVDFFVAAGINGVPDGIYGTSDRPGKHVLYTKTSGTPGSFNVNAQIFQPTGGVSTETVRGLIKESTTNNIYWFSAETTDPAIYMSKPPYTQSYRLYTFPSSPAFYGRSLQKGNFIMNYQSRFSIEKFVGQ